MYLVGKGADVMGPGTSTVQRIDWSRANEMQLMDSVRGRGPGLGCVPEFRSDCRQMGMGCACGGTCRECGLGLFDSMDPTAWGWQEWAIVGVGGYMLTSMLFTGRRAARQVRESVSSRVKGARRRLGRRVAGGTS